MLIKKFTAQSLPEALTKVKEDFGEEAVILKTRFSNKGNGNGSGKEAASVEVTAAIDKAEKKINRLEGAAAQTPAIRNRLTVKTRRPIEESTASPETVEIKEPSRSPSEMLSDIRKDLKHLRADLMRNTTDSLFGQPRGLQLEYARRLVEKHLPEKLAIDLVRAIPDARQDDHDPSSTWDWLLESLASRLSRGEPIKIVDSGATVAMLVGPAGSGKTSAAARLAFRFMAEGKYSVTLVTADNFRADSREQLLSLANVIGCRFHAVTSPEELTVLLKTFKEGLVIVDTSGVSSKKDMDELTTLVGAANPHEVNLVIPASIPAQDISSFIKDCPDLGVDKLLVTKLDQSRHRGGIVAAALEGGLKFSYQSASRELPGDFNLFDPGLFVSAFKPDSRSGSQDTPVMCEAGK
jgi:flagellar biosynthesis protein FlhF